MKEPRFLTSEQIRALHHTSLEQHGGQDWIRDEVALEGALAQPQHVLHYGQGSIFEIAAAYAFHLAEAQAFLDGNKRTGMAADLVLPSTQWSHHPPIHE